MRDQFSCSTPAHQQKQKVQLLLSRPSPGGRGGPALSPQLVCRQHVGKMAPGLPQPAPAECRASPQFPRPDPNRCSICPISQIQRLSVNAGVNSPGAGFPVGSPVSLSLHICCRSQWLNQKKSGTSLVQIQILKKKAKP